jgi:serine/threonine-protein kinase
MGGHFQQKLVNIALEKGYLDAAKVSAALRLLKEAQARGRTVRLHEVLLENELLTREQLVNVRRAMARAGLKVRVGDYDILSRIGRGAMGTVYRARQRGLDRIVALKVLASHLAANEEFVARFLREARLAARIKHANIVQVFDVGEWRKTRYIAMEYVDGRTLEEIVTASGPISETLAVSVAYQIAAALEHTSAAGIVHRDIKPANILITPRGMAKLADLGVALVAGEPCEDNVGTPYYMAPEQARNEEDLDVRADIYSLGCSIYFAVAGRPPFEGSSALDTTRMHAESPAPDAAARRPELSAAFTKILEQMMAKQRVDRFRSPAKLVAALAELMRQRGALP